MTLSLIITSYNAEKFIPNFHTWISNVHKHVKEIIIIDDSSEDTSYEELKKIQIEYRNIILSQTKKNSGRPSIPRNMGISLATSDRVVFLDIDDLLPTRYLAFLNKLNSNDCFSCTKFTYHQEKVNYFIDCDFSRRRLISKFQLTFKNNICYSGSSIPLSLAKEIKFKNKTLEDWTYWQDLFSKHKELNFYKLLDVPVFYFSGLTLSPGKFEQLKRVSLEIPFIYLPIYFFFTFLMKIEEYKCKRRINKQNN